MSEQAETSAVGNQHGSFVFCGARRVEEARFWRYRRKPGKKAQERLDEKAAAEAAPAEEDAPAEAPAEEVVAEEAPAEEAAAEEAPAEEEAAAE